MYSTFDSFEEAHEIASKLVESDLCACVNVVENKTSVYKWKGEVLSEKEFIIFCKTKNELKREVMKFITEKHTHETPCVLAMDCEANEAYDLWVNDVTK